MPTAIMTAANAYLKENDLAGQPAKPFKRDGRATFAVIDAALASLGVNGAISVKKASQDLLYADLVHDADVLAIVYNDAVAANNGIYAKVGASGSGSWAITGLVLPATFGDDLATALAQMEGVAAAAIATGEDATATAADRAQTTIDATNAAASATVSEDAAALAISAAAATGPAMIYDTKALADAALAGLPNLSIVEVLVDESLDDRRTRYRKESGVYAFKVYVDQPVQQLGSGNSYRIGLVAGTVDATVDGAVFFGGTASQPSYLGVNNVAPSQGGRANDVGYIAGAADVAGIFGGYDNVNNGLAGILASQHSIIYSGATHGTIIGGSEHAILATADYAGIFGGFHNTIEGNCDQSVILGGEMNTMEAGASAGLSGFRSGIVSGLSNVVSGQYGFIASGSNNRSDGTYNSILTGEGCTATGSRGLIHGRNIVYSGSYGTALGDTLTLGGTGSAAIGSNITVAYDYCYAFGLGAVAPCPGVIVFTPRNRSSVAGNNQLLMLNCSNETTNTTVTRLYASGTTYPSQAPDSIVCGTWWVTGVNTANGECANYKIDFVSQRIGTGTPTIKGTPTVTTLYNGLAIVTAPAMSVTTGGVYRVQVVGLAATNIAWTGTMFGQQTVFTP